MPVSYLRSLSTDEPFVRQGAEFYLADALGSTIAVTDPAGAVQTLYTYEAFGRTAATGASNSNTSQFTGRENDNTGLYYYRARYYSTSLQRFLSEDPAELGVEDTNPYTYDRNLYAYVLNDPLGLVDPNGLSAVAKIITLGHRGFKVVQEVSFEAAVRALQGFEDLIAGNRKVAKEIAKAAGEGKAPIHDAAHGPRSEGYRNHYHPHGRPGGHVFYGIATILAPFSMEVSGRKGTTNGQFAAAAAWDIASAIDPIFMTDVINWFTGLSNNPDQ